MKCEYPKVTLAYVMETGDQATSGGPPTFGNVPRNTVKQSMNNFTTKPRSYCIGSVSQYDSLLKKRHGVVQNQ